MADCSRFTNSITNELNFLKQAQNSFRDLNQRVNNIQTRDQGERLDELLGDLYDQFISFNAAFSKIAIDADKAGCPTQAAEARQWASVSRNFEGSSLTAQQQAKQKLSDIIAIEREAQNNEGARIPGAGANGAKAPATVPAASDTNAPTAASGSGATGPTPIDPNSPALGNTVPVDVTEPKINFGEDTSSDPGNTNNGLPGDIDDAQAEASYQDTVNFQKKEDWRVRLSLSPGADYLYKVPNGQAGILNPLQETDGVIFPYTPTINVNYTASYDATNLTHSNYKIYQYQSSSVDSISIACDFTAQDTYEANYLLAVIHFFRSLTKMFYGQDENPKPGTPPPLVYLFGLGAFQFEAHPLVITNFSYNLPADVDYIRATNSFQNAGINQSPGTSRGDTSDPSQQRLTSGPNASIAPGGKAAPANFPPSRDGTNDPTYVPTKINISLSAYPIVSRYDISRNFSVKKYATGELLRGTTRSGGGIW